MQPREPRAAPPLRGWRRRLALVWVVVVVGLYLGVRELGWSVLP